MTGNCLECGESWDENPARKVECPTCDADVGSPCRRPSGWECSPHAPRWDAAVDALCPLDGPCEAVDDDADHEAAAPDLPDQQATLGGDLA